MRIDPNRVSPPSSSPEVSVARPETPAAGAFADTQTVPGRPHTAEASKTPDLADLEYAAEKMNKAVRLFNQTLQFEVTKSNRIVIRVIDQNSGEIIRQIPPEEFMDSFKKVADALGVLIDRRV